MQNCRIGISVASASLLLFFGAAVAHAQMPAAVDAFITAGNALAKSANERVELGRATSRLQILRTELTNKLVAAGPDEKIRVTVDTATLLCEMRLANVEIAARRNYLQAVTARVEEVGKPAKIDNLESAFRTLFSGQSLDITVAIPTGAELEKARSQMRERCQRDVADFHRAYYGRALIASPQPAGAPEPADAPAFAAIGALIDTIVSIITPVVVEGAKIVDEERRRAAVLGFLEDEGNIRRIRESGMALATEVSAFTLAKRQRAAGMVVEQAALLRGVSIDLSKSDNCKAYTKAAKPMTALTDDFVLCWRSSWTQLEQLVASLLKAAEVYDQLADVGDTDNAKKAFEPLGKSLEAVGTTNQADLKRFWGWATRLVAFAQKVETAFNKENRQKIEKAIDDLVKTM